MLAGLSEGGATGQRKALRPGEDVALCVAIYVAETMEAADRDIRASLNHYYEYVVGAQPRGWDRSSFLNGGESLTIADCDVDWYDFLRSHDLIRVGTADHVVEKIQRYREECGLEHVMLLQQFPGTPLEKILASMTRFGEQVLSRALANP